VTLKSWSDLASAPADPREQNSAGIWTTHDDDSSTERKDG
jgi:hypothetical protein